VRVQVQGRSLELSNLEKVLYPDHGFTKGEVIDYYSRIAPVLLPHISDRALTRLRYPNGVGQPGFFEKNAPAGMPSWVRRVRLPTPGSSVVGRETIDYVVADDLPTVVWLANLAAIELHVPQWRISAYQRPDLLVIDLDPGPPAGLAHCARVALIVRERLAEDGLMALPKTSGRKGMQLVCALAAEQDAEEVSGYAKLVAEQLATAHPRLLVARMAKELRRGKVFLDWSQNNAAKTTVAPYSLRAGATPTVSTPLTWAEVEGFADGTLPAEGFTAVEVLSRIDAHGDLLAPLRAGGPRVPA
jgi:bifunctional non-homologous end joining protein LigD